MKQKYFLIAIAAIMFCTAMTFVSCSSDDDGSSVEEGYLDGSWTYSWEHESLTLKFKKDGNGICNLQSDYWGDNDDTAFTYHLENNHEGMITFAESVDLSDGYSEYYKVVYFVIEASSIHLYKSKEYNNKNFIVTLAKK